MNAPVFYSWRRYAGLALWVAYLCWEQQEKKLNIYRKNSISLVSMFPNLLI